MVQRQRAFDLLLTDASRQQQVRRGTNRRSSPPPSPVPSSPLSSGFPSPSASGGRSTADLPAGRSDTARAAGRLSPAGLAPRQYCRPASGSRDCICASSLPPHGPSVIPVSITFPFPPPGFPAALRRLGLQAKPAEQEDANPPARTRVDRFRPICRRHAAGASILAMPPGPPGSPLHHPPVAHRREPPRRPAPRPAARPATAVRPPPGPPPAGVARGVDHEIHDLRLVREDRAVPSVTFPPDRTDTPAADCHC